MTETATIETINHEQIATVTDLLLLRARGSALRLSANRSAFARDHQVKLARGSRPSIPLPPPVAIPDDDPERTLFVRARRAGTSTTAAAIVAGVFAIGILLTTLL